MNYIMTLQTNQIYAIGINTNELFTEGEKVLKNKLSFITYFDVNIESLDKSIAKETDNETLIKLNEIKEKKVKEFNEIKKEYKTDDIDNIAKKIKKELKVAIKNNTSIRQLSSHVINDKIYHVGQFESTLTRTLGIATNEFTDKIIIVETIYYEMLSQIIKNGFVLNDKKYVFAFGGAGQMREKKVVFIESESYKNAQGKLFAGLTDKMINDKKFLKKDKDGNEYTEQGIVINKLIAYKALCASSSIEWETYTGKPFDIRDVVIVPDFEFEIEGVESEYIDDNYQITPSTKTLVNPVSDGCGYVLPSYFKHNVQVRSSWIKGLLTPFDWIKFGKQQGINVNKFMVKDVWGNPQSLKGKKIIMTASQMKMWKYYDDFEDFAKKFEKNKCEFAIVNVESNKEKDFNDAKVSYQMIQTLYNMTDDEIKNISSFTRSKIEKVIRAARKYELDENLEYVLDESKKKVEKSTKQVKEDSQFLLDCAGVNVKHKRSVHKAMSLTDELLKDKYIRSKITDYRDSLLEDAQSGTLAIEGSRTCYILPDVIAFGQWLFDLEVTGGLEAAEVSCGLFEDGDTIDMLRSPHLFIEHHIATNRIKEKYKTYYRTMGVYTSIKSTSSFELAYDVDGDQAILINGNEKYVSGNALVKCAKRHLKENDVRVLDYELKNGSPVLIDENNTYKALRNAFSANIGKISNKITKLLNKKDVTKQDIDDIKLLKFMNNQEIDFAKTSYRVPVKDAGIKKRLNEIDIYVFEDEEGNKEKVNIKLPYFFIAAKSKDVKDVELINDSVMNRIYKAFKKDNFPKLIFTRATFDYTLLLNNSDIQVDKDISDSYDMLIDKYAKQVQSQINQQKNGKKNYAKVSKVDEFYRKMIEGYEQELSYLTDVIVKHIHTSKKTENQFLLWESKLGETMLQHLEQNLLLRGDAINCLDCDVVIKKASNNTIRCKVCAAEKVSEDNNTYNKNKYHNAK